MGPGEGPDFHPKIFQKIAKLMSNLTTVDGQKIYIGGGKKLSEGGKNLPWGGTISGELKEKDGRRKKTGVYESSTEGSTRAPSESDQTHIGLLRS